MTKVDFKKIKDVQLNLLTYLLAPQNLKYKLYKVQKMKNYSRAQINNSIKYESTYNHCNNPNCEYHDLELCNDQLFCPYCGCNTSSYDKMFF